MNGIRAVTQKGFADIVKNSNCDFVLIQETKASREQIPDKLNNLGYSTYVNPAKKKGYSGTMAFVREEPRSVVDGIGNPEFDSEGRTQTLEYDKFYLINSYFPNSQRELIRLDFKLRYNQKLQEYANTLHRQKPVVICGDFNVAHTEDDIARPEDNRNNPGFSDDEREWMSNFLADGYLDTFRLFTQGNGHYSWWTYRFGARARNIGWRIDYFVVSADLKDQIKSSKILTETTGSDHAPILLEMDS